MALRASWANQTKYARFSRHLPRGVAVTSFVGIPAPLSLWASRMFLKVARDRIGELDDLHFVVLGGLGQHGEVLEQLPLLERDVRGTHLGPRRVARASARSSLLGLTCRRSILSDTATDPWSGEGRTVETRIATRMGDGTLARMTPSEIRADIEDGVAQAVRRARVAPLAQDEIDHLVAIYASPAKVVGVDLGDEVVLSSDGTEMKTHATRQQDMQSWEQWMGADQLELCPGDYSLKVVRTILPYEAQCLHDALFSTIAPMQYGIMPNLGLYAKDDGPCDNWSLLLPQGRIDEARSAAEEAAEMAVADAVRMADVMWEAGADAIDFDTTGASGDPEFWATLRATEIIRGKYPDMGVQLGMAGEFVLGMHGQLQFNGKRLAGMWPLEQLRVVQEAGATIYGPVVNVNTGRSCAWNTARACAIVKPCMDEAEIPVHMNAGMGVGGVPMFVHPPGDAVARSAKAFVDILKVDGL
jgi:dimethylamine--corrinoid protein Co-methyltransferase